MNNQKLNALSCEQSRQVRKQANAFIQAYKKDGWKVIIKHFRYIKGQGSKLIRVSKYDKLYNPEFNKIAYGKIDVVLNDNVVDSFDLPLYRNGGGQTRLTVERDGQFFETVSNCVKTDQFFTSMGIVKCFEKLEKVLKA